MKDRLRVKEPKRMIAEMWRVIFDHFPLFLIIQKYRLWTEGPTDGQTYPLIEMRGHKKYPTWKMLGPSISIYVILDRLFCQPSRE